MYHTGLAKKFVCFHMLLRKNSNEHFDQPNISCCKGLNNTECHYHSLTSCPQQPYSLKGTGLPWCLRSKEFTCHCRRHRFDPWSGLLCPWDFLGQNTGVGCHFLFQRIFPILGSNPGLQLCRQIVYCLSHQGGPGNPNTLATLCEELTHLNTQKNHTKKIFTIQKIMMV